MGIALLDVVEETIEGKDSGGDYVGISLGIGHCGSPKIRMPSPGKVIAPPVEDTDDAVTQSLTQKLG